MPSLLEQFNNVLEIGKKKVAISCGEGLNVLTYEEVEKISENLKGALSSFLIDDNNACIGLYMVHNHLIPSIIISLQKLRFSFIFLNPYTTEKNLTIIKELQLKWLLSFKGIPVDFLAKHCANVIDFENYLQLWQVTFITNSTVFKDISYVVLTSGTRGEAKYVKVPHDCIMSNITSLNSMFKLTQDDVIYFGTALTFDPSIVELFLALTTGASLLITPAKLNPTRLLHFLFNEGGVTVLQMVPSLFLQWSQTDIEFILQRSSCRILALGGEKFPEIILNSSNRNVEVYNLYGITEVSCWASAYQVRSGEKEIPLGEALADTIFKVKRDGLEVFQGEGELFIGSFTRICLINGEKRFVKPTFRATGDIVKFTTDKGLMYVGRNNNIIKRFGLKIDLSKMEEIIFKALNVRNVCLWIENKNKLVTFLIIPEFNEVTKRKILDKANVKLLHSLPNEYFPEHIEIVPQLPLTTNGKINKNYLRDLYNNLRLLQIKDHLQLMKLLWSKYLSLNYDELERYYSRNFRELGGNSILSVQCLSEFQDLTKTDYSNALTTVFYEKSFKEVCDFIMNFKNGKRRDDDVQEHEGKKIKIDEITLKTCDLEVTWRYNLKACVDSSPTIIENSVAVGSFSHIFAILELDGNLISQTILPDTIEGACSVATLNDSIYTGCYDGKMYCIDVKTCAIIWHYSTEDRIKSTPSLCCDDQAIAFGSYDKSVHCIDIKTGMLVWKTYVNESMCSNTLCFQRHIYVATIMGTCLCLTETRGEIVWKMKVDAPVFGSPCIIGNIIWPLVNGSLISVSSNGKKMWTFKINGNIFTSLTCYEDYIIFGSQNHNLYCVQIIEDTCTIKYAVSLECAINSTPKIMNYQETMYIIAATNKGSIFIIEFANGNRIGRKELTSEIFSSPAVKDDRIFVGCRDNYLYCLTVIKSELNDAKYLCSILIHYIASFFIFEHLLFSLREKKKW